LTALVHGEAEQRAAESAGLALFGQGDLAALPAAALTAALLEAPNGVVDAGEIVDGALPAVEDLLVRCGLASSRGQARRTVGEGGAYLNNERVANEGHIPMLGDLLHGEWLVLRRGKRTVGGIRVEQ
jgi:tyrosyl-tRNA synthetase